VVLRVLPAGAGRARTWRFHPSQSIEEDGEDLLVRFRAGGLREIAEHVFTWGSDIVIEEPAALIEVMEERLAACSNVLRPIVSQSSSRAAG
jgi:predicted DNA-binding transcriptional regulator YafY